jgi:hypothetical protein
MHEDITNPFLTSASVASAPPHVGLLASHFAGRSVPQGPWETRKRANRKYATQKFET